MPRVGSSIPAPGHWLRKPARSELVEPPVAQSDDLVERGLAVPARLHALDESPGHAVVAGPAKLLEGQPLVARLFQRRDERWIDAVIARFYQVFGARGREAHLLHVHDVVPIDTVIPQAHECLGA